jgi:hypothetical protein
VRYSFPFDQTHENPSVAICDRTIEKRPSTLHSEVDQLRAESTMERKSPSKSSLSTQSSRSAPIKSQKTNPSDSPSSTANNSHGRDELDARLRSVLSHPLGLPLTQALHDGNPNDLLFLKRAFPNELPNDSKLNTVLENAVNDWVTNNTPNSLREPQLTKVLSTKIEEEFKETSLHSAAEVQVKVDNGHGSIDILLSSSCSDASTAKPLALIEVGRKDSDWWKKLDQNVKYLKAMLKIGQIDERVILDSDKPVLLAVLTIEKEGTEPEQFRVKFGVFLCTPKSNTDFRMTLLWHTMASELQEASKIFGKFLRVTYCFAGWRENNDDTYKYLSSNCCRVGNSVSVRFGLLVSY